MTQQTIKKNVPSKVAQKKSLDEIVDYFWWDLYGQVYNNWDSLPINVKNDYLRSINIKHLTDQQVQELFRIRHENNKDEFKLKLNELVEHQTPKKI